MRIWSFSAALVATAAAAGPLDSEPSGVAPTNVAPPALPRVDTARDWLYRWQQHWIEEFDRRFVGTGEDALVVPPSMLRVDFQAAAIHQAGGEALLGNTDFEATVHLPNIERRLRLFVTSEDLQESPAVPSEQPSGIRAGARFEPLPKITFEFGVRTNLKPSAFSALKWAPTLASGLVKVTPLAKLYVDSRLGYGASAGVALERWQRRWIVRSTSYVDWLHTTSGVSGSDWSQTFIVGYAPSIIRENQYGTVASGHDLACGAVLRLYTASDQRAGSAMREASVLLKRPLHDGWLFGYVEPIIRWNRSTDWHPDLGIAIGVDILFWGVVAREGGTGTSCQ